MSRERNGETGTCPKQPCGKLGQRMRNCRGVHRQVAMRLATIAAAFVLFSAPLAVEAQQSGKVYRVGILTNKASDPAEARLWQAFRSGLRERGWIEGQNILIEFRTAEGNTARLPELAADLVRLKVDLIVARSSIWVQAAKKATSSIPIVFLIHADPVGTGHVASLARPGGNITGLAALTTDLAPKELELLIAAVPVAKRIAVLWNPDTPSQTLSLKAVRRRGVSSGCRCRPSACGPRQSWRAPSRPWPEHAHRPFMCSAPQSSSLRDSAWLSRPSSTGCRRLSNLKGRRGGWWPDELQPELGRSLPARRHLCRQDPERCSTG
ncbi:MAG: hypothetical protein DMD96_16725 [Candidatus Rokuibacteriota bacterium]|nr:MAG: hypothetical protein DMD96_16725 [Candidatus Rokubacteria bacterium]